MVKRKYMIGNKEDTTMKKNILSLAALLIASAAVFTACSSDDNNVADQGTKTYTLAVQATKGDDASTRALSLEGKTLNATWATTENVYVKKGDNWATGSLQPEADGATATLKGTLSGIEINADDVLTLQFPKSGAISYAGQVGTLKDIADNFDYATADVTVASVDGSGNISVSGTATFQNKQAIVKFTLKDKDNAAISATKLVISVGTTDYTITPTSATNVIYAAIPGFEGQTVTLTATVGEETYIYKKASVSFTNGQYYEIGVKMIMIVYPVPLSAVTTDYVGSVICDDGKAYPPKTAVTGSMTAVGILGVVREGETVHGLILALQDAKPQDWNTINERWSGNSYALTELKELPGDALGDKLTNYDHMLGTTTVSDWAVAQKRDYVEIFENLGSTTGDDLYKTYDSNVNAYITTGVGGTALSPSSPYWSATEDDDGAYVWCFSKDPWMPTPKEAGYTFNIRPVLGF